MPVILFSMFLKLLPAIAKLFSASFSERLAFCTLEFFCMAKLCICCRVKVLAWLDCAADIEAACVDVELAAQAGVDQFNPSVNSMQMAKCFFLFNDLNMKIYANINFRAY